MTLENLNTTVAVIQINPSSDVAVQSLYTEALKLKEYAVARVILIDADLKPATEDLSIIAGLRKAIEEKRTEYIKPIRTHLDTVNEAFKQFTLPLVEAFTLNNDKVKAYLAEQKRKRTEAEAIERERFELARREIALKGETTVDLTPVAAPEVIKKIQTELGTVGITTNWKFEVVDFSQVPDEYKLVDATKIGKVVRAGLRSIPGVRIYSEESLRTTPKSQS